MAGNPTPRVDSRLIRAVKSEDRPEFIAGVRSCKPYRDKVIEVLTEAVQAAIIKSEQPEVLEGPNPMQVISDLMGYRRGLREAIQLLTNQESE